MSTIKGNFPVQTFPPQPVLTRVFKAPRGTTGRGGTDRSQPDTSWDTSKPAKPDVPAPKRNVVPPDGPPVDEFFRPLPVQ